MSVVRIEDKARKEGRFEAQGAAPSRGALLRSYRVRRLLRFGTIGLLLLIGVAVLGHWRMNRWSHVYVVDSRIAADVITVSSEVEGRVTAIPVVAGDRVARGDLLVEIDSRQADLELQQIDAEITRIEAEQSQLRAQQDMIRRQVASRLEAARAELAGAEAEHRASEAELGMVRSDFERVSSLHEQGIVAAQRFEEVQAQLIGAQQRELHTAAEIKRAQASLAVTEADATQIAVLDRQIATLDAEKAAQVARRNEQLVDLEHRAIHAAFDGAIDETFVDVGEYVSAGTRLLMYHDPTKVWVDANVKETEFGRLEVGAPATVTVDAYPGREFRGKVVRLGHAATSQFALLPSPNPSGNFTKVTQRLPVRIELDQEQSLLRPGMMVEVAIDVAD
jgi:membrane fusion protein (multidrug efflux system)